MKPMKNGSRAVVFLNRAAVAAPVSVAVADLGLPPSHTYQAVDLWSHAIQTIDEVLQSGVAPHGAAMFIVKAGKI
jgi:hypothetical protein